MKETHHIPPPCQKEIDVIYADGHILVVNKPDGLLSVPGKVVKDCVLHRVLFDYPTASIVHRLDLDTSGLMVLALSKLAVSAINRSFRERKIEKAYVALVQGLVDEDKGTIDLPLGHDPEHRPRQRVDTVAGKEAITRYEVIHRDIAQHRTRLLLKPETGRTHQLRLHLKAIGHPILGCDLYAPDEVLALSERLMLHASLLAFSHPESKKWLQYEAVAEF